jgi:alpha-L-fucosidase
MFSRRDFVRNAALLAGAIPFAASKAKAAPPPNIDTRPSQGQPPAEKSDAPESAGVQRLALEKLKAWEALGYGMFIHFGMTTFNGKELDNNDSPLSTYNPTKLDVDQWVSVARDAGMKYAVLTTKHTAGHCLWPTAQTDYHVGNGPVKTDVVEAFVKSCEKRGVLPGFYYCSWDNHNRFGSLTVADTSAFPQDQQVNGQAFTTRAYQDFQLRQMEELLTKYGNIGEIWIDIPSVLPRDFRTVLYQQMAQWQPDAVIIMNGGGTLPIFPVSGSWPTDAATLERALPNSRLGYHQMRKIENKHYYLPGETCDTLTKDWFYVPDQRPRSDAELFGMYSITRARRANFLLDVPPDTTGQIPDYHVQALMRLAKNIENFGKA